MCYCFLLALPKSETHKEPEAEVSQNFNPSHPVTASAGTLLLACGVSRNQENDARSIVFTVYFLSLGAKRIHKPSFLRLLGDSTTSPRKP